MKDPKLTSADIIRIRKSLGGGSKATTQTARILRKMQEKIAKRNRITVSLRYAPDEFDPDLNVGDIESPTKLGVHKFRIKRGGVPVARGTLGYRSLREILGRQIGDSPNIGAIKVSTISATDKQGKPVGWDLDAHEKYARKTLKPSEVRTSLVELKKRFPIAKHVSGLRTTGATANTGHMQRMRLPNVESGMSRIEKAVRKNSTKLRGALKGVEMLPSDLGKTMARLTPSAPLEAGFTTLATGGSPIAAVTSTAFAAGAQTGIASALKRAGALAANRAPLLAKVGSRVAVPLAVAGAGYDVFRTAQEGYRAYQAKADKLANEKYMSDNYGTIEAATATRRRRTGGL